MNKEDKKIQKQLVDEMMKVSQTNPDVMIYMQALMKSYEKLEQENQDLSRMCELYSKSLYYAELKDYKSRVEKAVEYIKEAIENENYFEDDIATDISKPSHDKYVNSNDLLTILQGEKDN